MHKKMNTRFVFRSYSKSVFAFDKTRIHEPDKPINSPINFFSEKGSSFNKKRDNTIINSGIVAMQSPTNTVDKCSCAIAKIVKGNKLDNTATPKQYIQYIFEWKTFNTWIFKIKENTNTTKKPIINLKDAICSGSKAIIAYFTDKKELPHSIPSMESKTQDDNFFVWIFGEMTIFLNILNYFKVILAVIPIKYYPILFKPLR